MIILISPAKKLDYDSAPTTTKFTQPRFLKDSQLLIDQLKQYAPHELASMMKLSDKLAVLNAGRYNAWKTPFNRNNAKQSVLAFKGDVYEGMQADTLDQKGLDYAQQHLRILSGLYGVLRPLDLMQAYRLEMGSKIKNQRGNNLYDFWGDSITDQLNKDLIKSGNDLVINLASNEYFKSVKQKQLEGELITPAFKDWKNGQYKMISFFAKKARGMMTRFIIDNHIKDVDSLLGFNGGGYRYNKSLSELILPVFTRNKA